ncbi:MAG TPA: ABC transporter permease [Pirellulales bacterium]|nr:ABC transporter permease [Pirellulales bacterium]
MVLETQYPPFLEWLIWSGSTPGALWIWLLSVAAVAIGGLMISFIALTARYGPHKAGDIIFKVVITGTMDLVSISPRRVYALAKLAVQESIRRRVLIGFLVFVVILAFAGWFLNPGQTDPARLYLSFVLTSTTYLVLLLALLLSAFSLPTDIQNRTIYTIVTKPVRPSEVVLGRTLGFVAIGTVLLALMGAGSYGFVVRTLKHTHELTEEDLSAIQAEPGAPGPQGKQGRTGYAAGHRHEVELDADGNGTALAAQQHWHPIAAVERDGRKEYLVGSPQGQLKARVPTYGKLSFKDRNGVPTDKGINVGNEWTYRSYIEGGSQASATWRFNNLRAQDFPDGVMTLEMTIRVFRTYKGDIDHGIGGAITLRNPRKPEVKQVLKNFVAKEFSVDRHEVPRKLTTDEGKTIDVFEDLVDNGELDIELTCLDRAQFFGMAQPDVYLLRREGAPWLNFAKGYVGIWLQMVLLTTFGVMWSTFLNGAVAMLATLATMVGGFFAQFLGRLALNEELGGGTFESLIRIVKQDNMMTPLDPTISNNVAMWLDAAGRGPLWVVARLLPDFPSLSDVNYVASGFDISTNLLLIHLTTAVGYAVPVLIAGFLFFKVREVAK